MNLISTLSTFTWKRATAFFYYTVALCTLILTTHMTESSAMTLKKDSPTTADHKKPLIILIGAPGSGKGTQAADIVARHGVLHISTGDMLRNEIQKGTALGVEAKSYMDKGALVPDGLIMKMLGTRIQQPDCAHGVLLDGFPRTVHQAKELQKMTATSFTTLPIFLDVSDDTVVRRISGRQICPQCGTIYHAVTKPPRQAGICDVCGVSLITRNDDKEETIRARLKVFHDQTVPVVAYYKELGILHTVNGDQPSENVQKACRQILQENLAAIQN